MPTSPSVWCINATQDYSALPQLCAQAYHLGLSIRVFHRPEDRPAVRQLTPPHTHLVDSSADLDSLLIPDAQIFFLPCVPHIDFAALQQRPPLPHSHCIQPLVPDPPAPNPDRYITLPVGWFGWRPGLLARRILREPSAWLTNGIDLLERIQHWPDPPRWQSLPLSAPGAQNYPRTSPPRLTLSSRVLAIIPFYRCEEWLHACLTSMAQQTRPPDNIVVIDDCSPQLPRAFLEPFPQVTLLSTTRNVGPEKIHNNIIKSTDYDAYMIQDADDWSAHDRLELSLRAAEESGADFIGTHEFCVDHAKHALELTLYPPDVNHAMSQQIGHHLLQTGSLMSRDLVMKVGGFDECLKLGADTDLIVRAAHVGRIIHLSSFCIFRRVRAGSLTTHAQTGYQSSARLLEAKFITIRAQRNQALIRAGGTPHVFVEQKDPVTFIHHQGPLLRTR